MIFGQHQQRFGFATDDKKGPESEAKKEEAKEEPNNKKATEEKKTEKASSNKKAEDTTSSSDEEGSGETLTKEDVQKIKKLIGEQDKEIETLKEQVK